MTEIVQGAEPIGWRTVHLVSCPLCHQEPGDPCIVRTTGRETNTHMARYKLLWRMAKTRQLWYVLLKDDPTFGLVAGDILRCVDYPYDAKVSVVFREWDGFDPECNQYNTDLAFIGFVPYDMEVW